MANRAVSAEDACGGLLKPARKLLFVFLAVALVPAGLAGWLGWRLMEQDRGMAKERLREIRERRADEVAQTLSRALAALEQDTRRLPPGSVNARGETLAYAPDAEPLPEAPARSLRRANRLSSTARNRKRLPAAIAT